MMSFLSAIAVTMRLMRWGSVSFQTRWTTSYSSVMERSAALSSKPLGLVAPKMSFSAVKAGSE